MSETKFEIRFPFDRVTFFIDEFVQSYSHLRQIDTSDNVSLAHSVDFSAVGLEEILLSAGLKDVLLDICSCLHVEPLYKAYEESGLPGTSYFTDDSL